MKKKFLAIISRIDPRVKFIDNIDDLNSGFEFNPIPTVMIRLMYSFPKGLPDTDPEDPEVYITISKYTIEPWNTGGNMIKYKQVLKGQIILREDGEIDYNFYRTILDNWRHF